jgi:hypothetical protein
MSNEVFNTQQIKLDLIQRRLAVEEQASRTADVKTLTDLAYKIRWITGKLHFLDSPEYQKRKAMP